MFDVSRLRTNYDVEMNVGEDFIWPILSQASEANLLPEYFIDPQGNSHAIQSPSEVRIVTEESSDAFIEITFPIEIGPGVPDHPMRVFIEFVPVGFLTIPGGDFHEGESFGITIDESLAAGVAVYNNTTSNEIVRNLVHSLDGSPLIEVAVSGRTISIIGNVDISFPAGVSDRQTFRHNEMTMRYVALDDDTRTALEGEGSLDEVEILIRQTLQQFNFPIGGERVTALKLRKLPESEGYQPAIGLFLNMDWEIAPRGLAADTRVDREEDVAAAVSFLPQDRSVAVGFTKETFLRLANDAWHQSTEIYARVDREDFEGAGLDFDALSPVLIDTGYLYRDLSIHNRVIDEDLDDAFKEEFPQYTEAEFNQIQDILRQALEGGTNWHPLRDKEGEVIGRLNSFFIGPMFRQLLRIVVKGETTVQGMSTEFVAKFNLKFTIKRDLLWECPRVKSTNELEPEMELKSLEADTGLLGDLVGGIGGGVLGAALGAIIGGPYGALVGLIAGALAGIITVEALEKYFADKYRDEVEEEGEEQVDMEGFLDSLPRRITLFEEREDPFYFRQFEVLNQFEEVFIDDYGMGIEGLSESGLNFRPYAHIRLIECETDNTTADYAGLKSLTYYIVDLNRNETIDIEEAINHVSWRKLQPEVHIKPVEARLVGADGQVDITFDTGMVLTAEQAEVLVENRIVARLEPLIPTHVSMEKSRVSAIRFDNGAELTVEHLIEMYDKRLICLPGYQLIRPRGEHSGFRPYFRGIPDEDPGNNLRALPKFR